MRTNRWVIAVAGILLQIALGAVYAWSVFRTPLVKEFGWSVAEVTLTFTISIFVLGGAAVACGSIARDRVWSRSRAVRFTGWECFWRAFRLINCGGFI